MAKKSRSRFNWIQFFLGGIATFIALFFALPGFDDPTLHIGLCVSGALIIAAVAGRYGGEVWETFVHFF